MSFRHMDTLVFEIFERRLRKLRSTRYSCLGEGVGGGGSGRGPGGNGGNCGSGVRASISKPTPFIYLAFEKTDPFI